MIAVDELFDAIPAINRSFHHVKAVSKSDNPHGDDFIEFPEFRLFLQTLRQFFEYYEAFNRYLSKVAESGCGIKRPRLMNVDKDSPIFSTTFKALINTL